MSIIHSLLARLAAAPLLARLPSSSQIITSCFSLLCRSLQSSSASPTLAVSSSPPARAVSFPSLPNLSASSIPVLSFSSVSPAISPSLPILSTLLILLSWPWLIRVAWVITPISVVSIIFLSIFASLFSPFPIIFTFFTCSPFFSCFNPSSRFWLSCLLLIHS